MNYAFPAHHSLHAPSSSMEQSRQRLISAVNSYSVNPALFPDPSQRQMLDMFKRGRLTIDELVYYLESKVASK
jgi:hypothetical protein